MDFGRIFCQMFMKFLAFWGIDFAIDFWRRFWSKMGQKMDPDLVLAGGVLFRPFSGYRPLGAFWLIFGWFWAPFWHPFGPFFLHVALCWFHFGSFWQHFGSFLLNFGSCWSILDPLGWILDRFSDFFLEVGFFRSLFCFLAPKSAKKTLESYLEHPNFLHFVAGKLSFPGPRAELLPQATESRPGRHRVDC